MEQDGSGSLDFEEFKDWWDSPEVREMRGEDQREARERAKLHMLEEAVAQKKVVRAQRREQFEEETEAASKLQRVLRGRHGRAQARQARIEWDSQRNAAVTKLQCAVRGRIARRQRSFAALALATKAEMQAKNDLTKLFWGDGADTAHREAQLRRDFQRLQASASAAVQQYTWEEWRWRWLEMRSGGWLERLEPSIQAEHCRRLAAASVLAEQEAQDQVRRDSEVHKAARQQARSPSFPAAERSPLQHSELSGAIGRSRSPGDAKRVGKDHQVLRTISGQPSPPARQGFKESAGMEWPEWYRSSRSPQLREHRSALEESTSHAINASPRMKRRADDLLQGMKVRPSSSGGCFLLPQRAEIALAMLQAADESTAPPGSTLRLARSHRMPSGEQYAQNTNFASGGATAASNASHGGRHAPFSPIKGSSSSATVQPGGTRAGITGPDVHNDTAASMSDSEYERGE